MLLPIGCRNPISDIGSRDGPDWLYPEDRPKDSDIAQQYELQQEIELLQHRMNHRMVHVEAQDIELPPKTDYDEAPDDRVYTMTVWAQDPRWDPDERVEPGRSLTKPRTALQMYNSGDLRINVLGVDRFIVRPQLIESREPTARSLPSENGPGEDERGVVGKRIDKHFNNTLIVQVFSEDLSQQVTVSAWFPGYFERWEGERRDRLQCLFNRGGLPMDELKCAKPDQCLAAHQEQATQANPAVWAAVEEELARKNPFGQRKKVQIFNGDLHTQVYMLSKDEIVDAFGPNFARYFFVGRSYFRNRHPDKTLVINTTSMRVKCLFYREPNKKAAKAFGSKFTETGDRYSYLRRLQILEHVAGNEKRTTASGLLPRQVDWILGFSRRAATAIVRDEVLWPAVRPTLSSEERATWQGVSTLDATDRRMRDVRKKLIGGRRVGSVGAVAAARQADFKNASRFLFSWSFRGVENYVRGLGGDAAQVTEAKQIVRSSVSLYATNYLKALAVAAAESGARDTSIAVTEQFFRGEKPDRNLLSEAASKAFTAYEQDWYDAMAEIRAAAYREYVTEGRRSVMALPQGVPVTPTNKGLASSDNMFRQGALAGAGYLFEEYYRPMTLEAVLVSLLAKTESDPVNQSLRVLETLGMAAGGLVGAGGIWDGFDSKLYSQLTAVTTGVFIPEVRKLLLRDIQKYIRHLGLLAFGTTERIPPGEPRDKYLFFPKGPIFGFGIDEYGVTCPTFITNIDNVDVSVHGLLVNKAHEFSSGIIDKKTLLENARNEGISLRRERERELAMMQQKQTTYAMNKLEIDVRAALDGKTMAATNKSDQPSTAQRNAAQRYITSFIGVYGDKDASGALAKLQAMVGSDLAGVSGVIPMLLGTNVPHAANAKDRTTTLDVTYESRTGGPAAKKKDAIYVGTITVVLNKEIPEGSDVILTLQPDALDAEDAKKYDVSLKTKSNMEADFASGDGSGRSVLEFGGGSTTGTGAKAIQVWSSPFQVQVRVKLKADATGNHSTKLKLTLRGYGGGTRWDDIDIKLELKEP